MAISANLSTISVACCVYVGNGCRRDCRTNRSSGTINRTFMAYRSAIKHRRSNITGGNDIR